MKIALLISLLATVAVAQNQAKPPVKPFHEPPAQSMEWAKPIRSVYVMHDQDCAKDFLRAQTLTGIELRKALGELVVLKCAILVGDKVRFKAFERVNISIGETKVPFRRVVEEYAIGPIYAQEFSWVRESDLIIQSGGEPKSASPKK